MSDSNIPLFERKRLLWVAIFIFALFSLLIARFFHIQIVEGKKWLAISERQHFITVRETFKRGVFYSNTSIKKGHPSVLLPFVIDVPKFHLFVDTQSVPSQLRDEISENLIARLELTIEERLNLRSHFDKRSRSRKLAMCMDKSRHQST